MIEPYKFGQYWNQERAEMDIQGLTSALGTLSSGERHLAQFYASVWLKHDVPEPLQFNLIEAAQVLDVPSMAKVIAWVRSPWWV